MLGRVFFNKAVMSFYDACKSQGAGKVKHVQETVVCILSPVNGQIQATKGLKGLGKIVVWTPHNEQTDLHV